MKKINKKITIIFAGLFGLAALTLCVFCSLHLNQNNGNTIASLIFNNNSAISTVNGDVTESNNLTSSVIENSQIKLAYQKSQNFEFNLSGINKEDKIAQKDNEQRYAKFCDDNIKIIPQMDMAINGTNDSEDLSYQIDDEQGVKVLKIGNLNTYSNKFNSAKSTPWVDDGKQYQISIVRITEEVSPVKTDG